EVLKLIGELEALLADPKKILKVVKDDLKDLKKKYGDVRRTQIEDREASDFRKEDLIPDEPVAVTISFKGYIKRLALDTFRTQSRGGKGIRGVITREADAIQQILVAQTHDQLLFFTNRGRVFPLRCWDIPEAQSRQSKGLPVINLIPIEQNERVTAMASIPKESAGACFFFATRKGEVKRVAAENFMNVRTSGILAMDLEPADELAWVARTSGRDDIIMVSEHGQSIRFNETDVRLSARASGGVRGMRFVDGDQLAGMDVVQEEGCMLMITSSGIGKRTRLSEYPVQGRGGIGVLTLPRMRGSGPVVAAKVVRENYQILLISREGTVIRQKADEISLQKRPARGVNVMRVDDGDTVASITCFPSENGIE
ncbi:MAG TPA: DNA gyrase C-terminal beta-propeller domain-containing protein, partial [Dehalococcoidia bacterium]|nr:DNA gyrase C-terminal beta-propeller domain-containing protein [Dehalococcoidia bacterium]